MVSYIFGACVKQINIVLCDKSPENNTTTTEIS
jgi:hypothetical protein